MEPRKVLSDLITEEVLNKAFEKIKSDPEFAVDDCHYIIARESRHQDVVDFFRDHFFPDEPVSKSIAHILPWDEQIQGLVMQQVKPNMTLALVSDTTGEIVCVRISHIGNKKDKFEKKDMVSEGLKKIVGLIDSLNERCNAFEHYNVEEYFHFFALGVHKEYRKRGIGTKMMKAAVALVKNMELGPVVIKGEGTSNYSKRIYEKLGFDSLAEVVYAEHKENGEVVFKIDPGEKSNKSYGKIVS